MVLYIHVTRVHLHTKHHRLRSRRLRHIHTTINKMTTNILPFPDVRARARFDNPRLPLTVTPMVIPSKTPTIHPL